MAGILRVVLVACLTAAFVMVPWRTAAAEGLSAPPSIWRAALEQVPAEARLMRQVVASTNESKMLLGLGASGAVVGGLGMIAYGASSSCKGKAGNSTTTCERFAVAGTVVVGAGAMTLVLWALSR